VLGGVLVDNLSWPWIFFVNVPIGVPAIALAWFWLEEHTEEGTGKLDAVGFVLAGLGLAGVLFALSSGPRQGWGSPLILGTLFGALACLAFLVRYELRHPQPLIDLRLLADRHFRTVNLVGFSMYGAFLSLIYVLPLYLQAYRDFSATESGTTQAPQAIGVFVMSNLFAKRAYKRFGARVNLFVGCIAAGLVSVLFAFVGDDTGLWIMRLGTFTRGLAIGTMFVTIQTAAYATMSLAQTARAVSIFTTQRQMASAVGTAVVATILTSALRLDLGLDAYRIAFLVSGALFIPSALWALRINEADVAATRE
jgi:EmrB/QacA subfamily drug resistance transporter